MSYFSKNDSDFLASVENALNTGVKVVKIPFTGGTDTGGGIFAWKNPEAGAIVVTRVVIDATTVATAACTLDVGTTATSATTSSDNLIDAVDVHTATTTQDNESAAGTNGKHLQRLAVGKWVTASTSDSTASAGLVGNAYIHYFTV